MDQLFKKIGTAGYSSGAIIKALEPVLAEMSTHLRDRIRADDEDYSNRENRKQELIRETTEKLGKENSWLMYEIEALQGENSDDDMLLSYTQGFLDCAVILKKLKLF